MVTGPILPIEPPIRKPRVGGIGMVAQVEVSDRIAGVSGVRYAANPKVIPDTEALRQFNTVLTDKSPSGITLEDGLGEPFTIFAAVECLLGPKPDELARATEILDAGYDRVIEEYVAAWAAGGLALTAGGSPLGAIARVEQAIDLSYLGQGIILLSRYDLTMADNGGGLNFLNADGVLTTVNGTPVVASGWIDPGEVYGIGALKILHSTPDSYDIDEPIKNRHFALAESVYTCAVDNLFRVKSATT